MVDVPNVRLVDSHAERDRRDDDAVPGRRPPLLCRVSVLRAHARVVWPRGKTRRGQERRDAERRSLQGHVDDRARCVRFLRATVRPDGSWPPRPVEFSASISWCTASPTAGTPATPTRRHPRLDLRQPAGCRVRRHRRTGRQLGLVAAVRLANRRTSSALLSLAALGADLGSEQVRAGMRWLVRMQNKDGSWGCFTRNAPVSLDAPCSIFTAHACLALHEAGGLSPFDTPIARALEWFGGSSARTGRSRRCGTATTPAGQPGCCTRSAGWAWPTGRSPGAAGTWLLRTQNPDGGFGDGSGAGRPGGSGLSGGAGGSGVGGAGSSGAGGTDGAGVSGGSAPGASTPEETAWALLGLVDAGLAEHPAAAGPPTGWPPRGPGRALAADPARRLLLRPDVPRRPDLRRVRTAGAGSVPRGTGRIGAGGRA